MIKAAVLTKISFTDKLTHMNAQRKHSFMNFIGE
jgi:hypothetical protein